ncbi:alpha/beta hydrolase family protein [Citrus sinensis]|uniref:Alpha/beta hydrolase family protein n=1 Tax=Citrus sinensis TaxID=2711 RepID=A0ACB8LBA9_CITSI|nr:alpha/beta hydrolase family protein [Citrus sinensis]
MVTVNLGMLHYVLDHVYGAFMHRTKISPPFFSRGWGGSKLELLERLIKQLFPEIEGQNWPPSLIQPIWRTIWETQTAVLREGVFRTPCDEQLMSALPPESHNARVAFLAPKCVPPQKMACVVHLAGTGDHTFERRLRLGGPLLKENIATMVLERLGSIRCPQLFLEAGIPFYGQRRPLLQRGAKLLCVSDLLLLGRATIEEARCLLHWLEWEAGFGKMGVCGLSMGGVHAAMVGSLHPTPVATLPFLSPHSAVVAFCEGILRHGTAWEALREELAAKKVAMTLEEVRERMRNVLSLTDVTRFPIPKIPNAVIFVAATDDGYIPKHSVLELQKAWPGSEVRWVTGGHVSSFLLHNGEFRRAIVDGLNRLPWKESPQ